MAVTDTKASTPADKSVASQYVQQRVAHDMAALYRALQPIEGTRTSQQSSKTGAKASSKRAGR